MRPLTIGLIHLSGVASGFGILLSMLGAPAELTIISFTAAAASFIGACTFRN